MAGEEWGGGMCVGDICTRPSEELGLIWRAVGLQTGCVIGRFAL